jgi:hypothetical protein
MLTIPMYLDGPDGCQHRRRLGFVQIEMMDRFSSGRSGHAYRVVEPASLASDGIDYIGVLQEHGKRRPTLDLIADVLFDWQKKNRGELEPSSDIVGWVRSWPIEDDVACSSDWLRGLKGETFEELSKADV